MKQFQLISTIILLCICAYGKSYAATYDIPDGDVTALIAAMEAARIGDPTSTINLAANGEYVLTAVYGQAQTYGSIGLPTTGIDKTLTINGNGATIRRATNAPKFRILFAWQYSGLILNDLTLEGGETSSGKGGAVFAFYHITLRINNCTFRNNKDFLNNGGAVYVGARSDAEIKNSQFLNNEARLVGGAIYNVVADLLVENCYFNGNVTTSNSGDTSGGAVYIDGGRMFYNPTGSGGSTLTQDGEIIIRDSKFENNHTSLQGSNAASGALYIYAYNNNQILVERCSITHNSASGFAGGVYLKGSTIDGTAPNSVDIIVRDCLVAYNHSKGQGGGFWIGGVNGHGPAGSNPTTQLVNCTVAYNSADVWGGGIQNNFNGLEIMNCTIAYNEGGTGGGGLYSPSTIQLNNSIIAYNEVATPNGYYTNCRKTFTGNNNIQFPAINAFDRECTAGITIANPMLGTLKDNGGPTLTMELLPGSPAINPLMSVLGAPSADARGVANVGNKDIGAFEFGGVVVVNTPTNLTATTTGQQTLNLTWNDNSNNETGFTLERSKGNIFNFAPIATLPLNTTAFPDNNLEPNTTYYYRIKAEGGDSDEWSNLTGGTTATAKACDNTLYKPVVITNPVAIVGDGTSASCTQTAIQAALNVGGQIICNCGANPVSITLTNELQVKSSGTVFDGGGLVTLNGNNATRIFNVDEGVDFTLQNTNLINGRAPATGGLFAESGGAILVGSGITGNGGGLIKIINCDFENNTIANINSAERGGGAIYTYSLENLIISECTFTGNTSNVGGAIGGIGSQMTLINTDFINNEAAGPEAFLSGTGGAIYIDGIDLESTAPHSFTVCGCNFTGNQGKHQGGAIYMAISDGKQNQVNINKSSFENNRLLSSTDGLGGAIFHVEDDFVSNAGDIPENLVITNSTFHNNTCSSQGGALWTITSGGGRIENCTFEGNDVTRPGACLGGAIAFSGAGYGGNYLLNNNTFANNTSAHFAGAIFGGGDNIIEIRNSIFSNNTSDFEWEGHQVAGAASYSGTANIQFPENRWNGTPDNIISGRISIADPLLTPLAFNGGFTKTMALQPLSIAIDNVNVTVPTITDQRGLLPVGVSRDLGAFEYGAVITNAPIVLSFNPLSGGLGSPITIIGTGFTGATSVSFNFVTTSTFTILDDQTIIATVPDLATTGKIGVTNAFGTGYSIDDYTVIIPLPSIASFSPTSATGGATVTITGTDFLGATEILFNGVIALNFTVVDANTIEVVVPNTATSGKISVTTGGGTTVSIDDFTVAPGLTSFTPLVGGVGTEVTIRGTNLNAFGMPIVTFNGVAATGVIVDNSTTIRATVAVGTLSGANPIVVTLGGTPYNTSANFTVIPVPTFTGFTPTSGGFGATVTITGTDFTQVNNITFDGVNALGFAVINSTTLEAYVPQAATTGQMTIITPAGTINSAALTPTDFTVLPSINSFTPNVGTTGTAVTINGVNIGNPMGVSIGGTPVGGGIVTVNSRQIQVTVGAGATGIIQVTNADGNVANSEGTFTFVGAPSITSFTPTAAGAGATVTITGTNLLGVTAVTVGGVNVPAFDASDDGTTITFDVPDNVTTGVMSVTTVGGVVSTTALGTPNLSVEPTVLSFSPTRGGVGTTVTITGANFTGASSVTFGGVTATSFSVVNATTITAVIEAGMADGVIAVTTAGGTDASVGAFDFVPTPTITSVTPNNATVGTSIAIQGTNFLSGETMVSFNGTNATSITFVDANNIMVVVPTGATTGQLIITTPGGTVTSTFTVNPPAPNITAFSPTSGVVGTTVNITGTNLGTTTGVSFNGIPATNVTITNTTITAVVPAGATNGVIAITTPTGSVSTLTATPALPITIFTVEPTLPPAITNFTPTNGSVGTSVTINGANFTNATQVTFNGTPAVFTVNNNTRITATVPNTVTGLITVTTAGGSDPSDENFVIPFEWNGSVSTDWNTANNWTPNVVPNDVNLVDAVEIDVFIPNQANDPILSNNVTVRNIQVLTGASLQITNVGVLSVRGTIANQGTFTSNGTLGFNGTVLQQIPNNITQFNNLVINNPAHVQMSANWNVSGTITFIQGNLQLNGRTLDLGTTGSLVGENNLSCITGNTGSVVAVRTGGANFLQFGMNVAGLGANVTIPNVTGLSGITIRRGHTRRGNLNLGMNRYFAISPAGVSGVSNLNASLVFNYFENELTAGGFNGASENSLILWRYNGTDWEPKTSTVDNANNRLTLFNIPKFSEWTAGNINLPLPISLSLFEAKRKDAKTVQLIWNVSIEKDLAYYEVQKSENGSVFQTIGSAEIQRDKTFPKYYSFMDWGGDEDAFYRLKFVETNAKSSYSNMVYVGQKGSSLDLSIYPNPTTDFVNIHLPDEQNVQLELVNEKGQMILSGEDKLSVLEDKLNQYLPHLSQGVYILKVKDQMKNYHAKLVKQ
jgi:hypothetical protein